MKSLLVIALLCLAVSRASAHEVRPAYLELTERLPGEFDVLWKVPALGGVPLAGEEIPHEAPAKSTSPEVPRTLPCGCPAPTMTQLLRGMLPIHPSLPKDAEIVTPPRIERLQGAVLRQWTIRVPRGLDGWDVTVHGLPTTMIDVLVRVALADGRVVSRMLRPDAPAFTFAAEACGPAGGYFILGVEHILFGIDHLLFVFALMLIARGVRLLVMTITAFTLAHSLTLGLATLGYVHVPSAPVEAVIALSIVLVALEIIRAQRGTPGFTERVPWLVAGVFGLLHGFGFAGALSQVGLPANDIPLALLWFNVGVEAGQLAFVAVALGAIAVLRRLPVPLPRWAPLVPPYAVGSLAMVWVIERSAAIW